METKDPLNGKKILIFVVAYNAEATLHWVLDRVPQSLCRPNVEVLVIDDCSRDDTFRVGLRGADKHQDRGLRVTYLRNPENQGYGGNQKLGYRYAIDHGFDVVALVHGDGQYAPEKLPELLAPLVRDEADAVFGSRMMEPGQALRGGMPLYKYVGNKILTKFQNALLGSNLSEFHSGYRLYTTNALRRVPFERNTNDFHFDTEIIVQLALARLRISEIPIPTYYGDEICHVNGFRYAWNVARTMLRARCHQANLFYDRRFEVDADESENKRYALKLGYPSSHTMALDAIRPGSQVLDLGCGAGSFAELLAREKHCRVTGVDQLSGPVTTTADGTGSTRFIRWDLNRPEFPFDVSAFDQVCLLDIIEHLRSPEVLLDELRAAAGSRRPEVLLTTPNVGFLVTRGMLLCGQFNYGRVGILDRTHTRLFTFASLRSLLEQSGYQVIATRGVAAPFARALGNNRLSRTLARANQWLADRLPGLFAYQIFVRARSLPTIEHLLQETVVQSQVLTDQFLEGSSHHERVARTTGSPAGTTIVR